LAGDVLKEVDPVAFRTGVNDHIDSLIKNGELLEVSGDYYFLEELSEELEFNEIELDFTNTKRGLK
jgi:biotin operon repressor